ncbi:cysteine-rich CWC family protein [Vogesella sp. LYT5W]|uniref:Cysteine-rich CWC family protein n=1 Tax=Vogesella margarita TaxID=2984199 RepID=A0ABT5IMU0_9NEIS|nr:cysteine-rich CWC family protein [Vogesella margarita]MDC7713526.1 cysteine-rich CWC family protein [Vogesella margarita]
MPDNIVSPCIRQCQLDASGRYCTGCLRTLAEISGWASASRAQKQAALQRIASLRQPLPLRDLNCGRCGQPFHCGTGGDKGGCWCMALPPLASAGSGGDCLCPACLQQLAATR